MRNRGNISTCGAIADMRDRRPPDRRSGERRRNTVLRRSPGHRNRADRPRAAPSRDTADGAIPAVSTVFPPAWLKTTWQC